jgi:SynChlorMet cassette protein ScmC
VTGPDLGLALADGSSWRIRALDRKAEATVRGLGKVMRLKPVQGKGKGKGRGRGGVCEVLDGKLARGRRAHAGQGLVCRLGPDRGRIAEVFKMEQVASAIAARSLARGGLLLHGALAVRDGAGFVLAGPSGIGKSTASRRLPPPWQSLSDDCTLAVRDTDGRYWAHPWPTWSLIRDHGPVESWPVEQAVPLKALLFLAQSPLDRAEPVTATPAAAFIMESAYHLARAIAFTPDAGANRALSAKYLHAARDLAAAVPAFRFHISLTGRFWDEIERTVGSEPRTDRGGTRRDQNSDTRNQSAEWRRDMTTADDADGRRYGLRRNFPEPPRRLVSGNPRARLFRFQAGERTFLKLVRGRRVVASASDLHREWSVRRPSRRSVTGRAAIRRRTPSRRLGPRSSSRGTRE